MEKALDPYAVLEAFERLEVGPPQLEARRMKAEYRVIRGHEQAEFGFEYHYDEEVFDPQDEESQNLAALMAAQPALNYGLFCRQIRFRGVFSDADRRFLREMAANTAREILVNKFLQPNPFLTGPASQMEAAVRPSYLRADLQFDEVAAPHSDRSGASIGKADPARVAILSSGGKDSLLTYGLLSEIGAQAHPIYVNESGRHWFTALNAYRHFSKHVPGTARVWTNSDRLFNWMLRRMPFIRQDFQKLRSDDYPIRLWTVAVFLFGALPLLRKRGAGRLAIGNEFDTTQRLSHQRIAHYNGLYDQSRYFDNALSRFYRRKGWGLSQFSVLRPLSEVLIQKILAERYPELLRLQVSCHAAHKSEDGQRVLPCGRCEKCRRIAAMLTALGQDAAQVGYSEEQVRQCLKAFAQKGVHQERASVRQLAEMLVAQGSIESASETGRRARAHPEILQMRFDRQRSPLDTVPIDLRSPLYSIFLEHAQGAVRRSGRMWLSFDPLGEESLTRPYRCNSLPSPSRAAAESEPKAESYLLAEMTWPQAQKRFQEVDLALLPVGAIEQHGPHLPLDTDSFDADYLARRVAEGCSAPQPLVLPLIPYGVSYHHDDFAGTVSISNQTLSQMVYEIGMSAARQGITKLVIINGHGGNAPTLKFAAQLINRDAHIFTCVDSGETSDHDVGLIAETPNDIHAGEIETSTALAVRPHLVHLEWAPGFVPRFSNQYLDFTNKRSVEWFARTVRISSSGVLGDARKASRQKGERIWEVMVRNLVEFVEDLKGMSLDEIYEKRY